MLELRPFKPEDYMTIQRRHFDSMTFLNFPNPKAIAENLARGPAFTLTNGQPIACGGILIMWKGVGEGWVVTSHLVEEHPILFAKTVWRGLEDIIKKHKLERVQTLVDAEHKVSQKWVTRMGFHKEGLMVKYIGGRDYFRYALIRS
jgi:hypothetical protein